MSYYARIRLKIRDNRCDGVMNANVKLYRGDQERDTAICTTWWSLCHCLVLVLQYSFSFLATAIGPF